MINPQSTSYPVLATIQALGITDPDVQRGIYWYADAFAQMHRDFPRATLLWSGKAPWLMEIPDDAALRKVTQEQVNLLSDNMTRARQWCLDDIKATKARLQREARNERKRLARAAAREQAALDKAEAEEDARLAASVRSNNVSEQREH